MDALSCQVLSDRQSRTSVSKKLHKNPHVPKTVSRNGSHEVVTLRIQSAKYRTKKDKDHKPLKTEMHTGKDKG